MKERVYEDRKSGGGKWEKAGKRNALWYHSHSRNNKREGGRVHDSQNRRCAIVLTVRSRSEGIHEAVQHHADSTHGPEGCPSF